MALGKLVKGGSLVLAGALLGGLLSYNSEKTKIVAGINDISNTAIEYKTQAKNLSTDKEDLEKEVAKLTTSLNSEKETVKELTENMTRIESEKAALEERLENLVSQGNADAAEIAKLKAEIQELKDMIAFKDMLLQTTYERAMELEEQVEDLTKQLEEAQKDSKNIVDKANEQIKQANQDQVDILNAVNQAKEKINNN